MLLLQFRRLKPPLLNSAVKTAATGVSGNMSGIPKWPKYINDLIEFCKINKYFN